MQDVVKKLSNGTPLGGFGYPKTERLVDGNLSTFHLRGTWSEGIVEDYHAEGTAIVRNSCYQTTMRIDNGCSGGPVFDGGYVVALTPAALTCSMKKARFPSLHLSASFYHYRFLLKSG